MQHNRKPRSGQRSPPGSQRLNGHGVNGHRALTRTVSSRSRIQQADPEDDDEEKPGPTRVDLGALVDFPAADEADDDTESDDGADGESFLFGGISDDLDEDDAMSDEDSDANEPHENDWLGSEAETAVSGKGSEVLPGNFGVRVALWMLYYFRDVEKAVVFAQILYWFGRSKTGRRLAPRRERGHAVVDKTYRDLADELGIRNERRIAKYLKSFKKNGLLDYRVTGIGKARTTRIWLLPAGILKVYQIGCREVETVQKHKHDKSGGA